MDSSLYEGKQWLSFSSMTDFVRCPRRYFFKQGLRLRPMGQRPHAALSFGGALHRALPHALEGDLVKAMEEFDKEWDEDFRDDKRHRAQAQKMLMHFMHQKLAPGGSLYTLEAPPEELTAAQDRSHMEWPFALDLGASLPFVGYIDGAGRHRDTGELWAIEFKTTSQTSSWFINTWENSPQCIGYTLALQVAYGEVVRGCIVDALKVPKGNGAHESLSIPKYFESWHMDSFVKMFQLVVGMIEACEAKGEWPQNYMGCTSYPMFGSPGFPCEFAQLCAVEDWTSVAGLWEQAEKRDMPQLTMGGQPLKKETKDEH